MIHPGGWPVWCPSSRRVREILGELQACQCDLSAVGRVMEQTVWVPSHSMCRTPRGSGLWKAHPAWTTPSPSLKGDSGWGKGCGCHLHLDFKAFDSDSHSILQEQLSARGSGRCDLCWVKTCLCSWDQRVVVDGVASSWWNYIGSCIHCHQWCSPGLSSGASPV